MAEAFESVLVVESDDRRRRRMRAMLSREGFRVFVASNAVDGLASAAHAAPRLCLVSLALPDLAGLRAVEVFGERTRAPIIALSEAPTVVQVVEAVRRGAADVLSGQDVEERLLEAVDQAMLKARTDTRLQQVREDVRDQYGFRQLLTQSPRMLAVFDQIQQVARTDATALILGETGTGKELVSRAIHDRSRRRDEAFIAVNCGAFTETLLESELFGHEKGSFTGAVGRREGLFEMASGGSLFLDELGETSLNVQVNLLRVLEEMTFRRVGGREPVRVDVRIIAATNVHLEEAVSDGSFRQDLFYRLSVFPIRLPPLRERREDIPLLMRHFLDELAERHDTEPPVVSADAMRAVLGYRWPGNVRQLRAMCERWVITHGGRRLEAHDLSPALSSLPSELVERGPAALRVDTTLALKDNVGRVVEEVERAYLFQMLQRHRGHQGRTAEAAGITRRTLYTKLRDYDLDPAEFKDAAAPSADAR